MLREGVRGIYNTAETPAEGILLAEYAELETKPCNKASKSDCKGKCTMYSLGIMTDFTLIADKIGLTLIASYEGANISTIGKQDQRFFGDDPGTPDDDETGLELNDINTKINSEQSMYRLQVGIRF